jgi:hypothetical protein
MVEAVIRRSALLMIEYLRSFSVVPPCEAFASLFPNTVFDYRQKKPLKYSILSCSDGLIAFLG